MKIASATLLHRLLHFNARSRFLDTSFKAQNTLNLMNKTLHFFGLVALFKNNQTESIKKCEANLRHFHITLK